MGATPPAIPTSIDVGPFTYSVLTGELDILRAQDKERAALWGHTDHTRLQITVATGEEALMRQRVTLVHEWLHTLCSIAGLASELGCETEEKVVERLAPVVLDGIRRNPALIAFLVTP